MDKSNLPPDLKKAYEEIEKKSLDRSRKKLDLDSEKYQKVLEDLNNKSFTLRKDLLTVVGTIFGSSIALATGRNPDAIFIAGEFFLLCSICSGLGILTAHLKDKEWEYAFFSKMSVESFLILNKNAVEKFEKDNLSNIIKDYQRILDKNQSGILYKLFKIVPLEKWTIVFDLSFISGITLILLSLLSNQDHGWLQNSILLFIK
ncbi:hypothetical protein KBD75_04370 [Candidatus Woesebacteria bacterium]|nr:hypothetical protein [Candidatus Woesebacteria bacterium]